MYRKKGRLKNSDDLLDFENNGFRGRMRGASVHFRGGFDGMFEKLSWCRLCLKIAAVGRTTGRKVFAGKAHDATSYSKRLPNLANILNFNPAYHQILSFPPPPTRGQATAGVYRKT